jgi:hypothetical protein
VEHRVPNDVFLSWMKGSHFVISLIPVSDQTPLRVRFQRQHNRRIANVTPRAGKPIGEPLTGHADKV